MLTRTRPDWAMIIVRIASLSALLLIASVAVVVLSFGWSEYGWLRPAPRLADVPVYPQAYDVVRQDDGFTFKTDDSPDQVFAFYESWAAQHEWVLADSLIHRFDPPNANYHRFAWPVPDYPQYGLGIHRSTDGAIRPVIFTIRQDRFSDGWPPTWTPAPNQATPVP